MFGMGVLEIVVILVVALLVFGPDRLPEMVKQVAGFIRDLRKMVANARRDINVSAKDLGIDEEDLETLRALRNPKSFVRDQVLDGMDLDDLVGDDLAGTNGGSSKGKASSGKAAARPAAKTSGGAGGESTAGQDSAKPAEASFDPDAT